MINYADEVKWLQKNDLLVSSRYFTKERYIRSFSNVAELGIGVLSPIVLPIISAICSFTYAVSAIWAALRAIGNLLICKPTLAGEAFNDLGVRLYLAFATAIMVSINAIAKTIELLARLVTTWTNFSFQATRSNRELATTSFPDKLISEKKWLEDKHFLASEKYFNQAKFFTPYRSVSSLFGGALEPVVMPITSASLALIQAMQAVYATLQCVSNLVICKPTHAGDALRDLGVHLSLSLALAAMIPVHALVYAIAVITRIGKTWHAAYTEEAAPAANIHRPAFAGA